MIREAPPRARELGARLSALFVADSGIAERLNDAQRRLQRANDQLWSGLSPDAPGLVLGGQAAAALGSSPIARLASGELAAGGQAPGAAVLGALQQAHWAIHRAFCEYQLGCEERRQLAVEVGELSQELIGELVAAGWSEQAARGANVHELAGVGAALGAWEQGR
jgi:hypothetical protein